MHLIQIALEYNFNFYNNNNENFLIRKLYFSYIIYLKLLVDWDFYGSKNMENNNKNREETHK